MIDPSIPLSTVGGDPRQLMTLLDLSMKLQANRQAVQAQNQLKEIFSDPSNLEDGMPNAAAISKVYAVNPQYGMNLQKNMLAIQNQKNQEAYKNSQLYGNFREDVMGALKEAVTVKQEALARGLPEEAAQAEAQKSYTESYDRLSNAGYQPFMKGQRREFDYNWAKAKVDAYQKPTEAGKTPDERLLTKFETEFEQTHGRKPTFAEEVAAQKQIKTADKVKQYDKPVEVETQDKDGKPIQTLAQQDTDTGQWVTADQYRTPIDPKKMKIIKAADMGGREAILLQRGITAAADATADLENVVEMPVSVSTGYFGGRKQGPGLMDATTEVLANKMTTEEVQMYNNRIIGLGRALAGLETGGVYINQHLMDQYDKLAIKEGDTNLTKIDKLATARQNAENAMESMLSNPRLGTEQRKLIEALRDRITTAIPWKVHDVNQLLNAKKQGTTLRDFAKEQLGSSVPKEAIDYLKAHPETAKQFEDSFKLPAGSAAKLLGQ